MRRLHVILRLPWAVAPLFEHWLEEHFPDGRRKCSAAFAICAAGKTLTIRAGKSRQTGEGIFAEQIAIYV